MTFTEAMKVPREVSLPLLFKQNIPEGLRKLTTDTFSELSDFEYAMYIYKSHIHQLVFSCCSHFKGEEIKRWKES